MSVGDSRGSPIICQSPGLAESAIRLHRDDNAEGRGQSSLTDIAPSVDTSRTQEPSNNDEPPGNVRASLHVDSLPEPTSSADLHDRCHALILQLRGDANYKEKIGRLADEDAKQIVDFLNVVCCISSLMVVKLATHPQFIIMEDSPQKGQSRKR